MSAYDFRYLARYLTYWPKHYNVCIRISFSEGKVTRCGLKRHSRLFTGNWQLATDN